MVKESAEAVWLLCIFESFFPPISFISLAPLLEAQGLGLDRIEGGGEEAKGAMAEWIGLECRIYM